MFKFMAGLLLGIFLTYKILNKYKIELTISYNELENEEGEK